MRSIMIIAYHSLRDIEKAFPDREACYAYLEKIRWNGKPVSPFNKDALVTKVKPHLFK